MRLSPVMFAYLRLLLRGPVPLTTWKKWDQRRMRALYFGGYFTISRTHLATITNKGIDVVQMMPVYRKDSAAPTFRFRARGRTI